MDLGVLVIAHGSSNSSWVQRVDEAVHQVKTDEPLVVSFLEMVPGRSIEDGLRQLEEQGERTIRVLPLFVSAGSTHIEEIAYLLGLVKEPKIPMDESPIAHQADLILLPTMGAHPLIAQILVDRARRLSTHPQEECLLLVGHGSKHPYFHERWVADVEKLGAQILQEIPFASFSYAFLHPDRLREIAQRESKRPVVCLPLFLSGGYFTRKVIPSRLEGLSVRYDGETYLPHSAIVRWMEEMIAIESRV
jgi:sirohydrochlorin ferrochelatase